MTKNKLYMMAGEPSPKEDASPRSKRRGPLRAGKVSAAGKGSTITAGKFVFSAPRGLSHRENGKVRVPELGLQGGADPLIGKRPPTRMHLKSPLIGPK